MSINEDFVQSGSDSFWEVGKYMRTVKRCDNGYQLCHQLRRLIEERSDIEKKYSALLQDWTKKWNSFLDKGPEYGTTLGAWRGVLTEADHVADLHTVMAERMMTDVHSSIKVWQRENYHKSMMHFKETKEFEEGFRKAQKPWGKCLSKVVAAKKDYHAVCRSEKTTGNQENNAKADTTISQDQLKKLQDKLRKCQQEVESTRDKYTAVLDDLNSYNPKYIEDMSEIYSKCQEFEQRRLDFFKKTLFSLHACLDLSVESSYSQIYTSLHTTIDNLDPSKDLKWWSSKHGVDMGMNWPEFEEYSPELQSICKGNKTNLSTSDGEIRITSIKQHSRDSSFSSLTEQPQPTQLQQLQRSYSTQMSNNSHGGTSNFGTGRQHSLDSSFGSYTEQPQPSQPQHVQKSYSSQMSSNSYGGLSNYGSDSNQADSPVTNVDNLFGDNEPEEGEGWVVRALYDYTRVEEDELEFKSGDTFVQLEMEDEMGWCKGKKGGQVGFYPKNYVDRI